MNRCGIALGIAFVSVFELEGLCFAHTTSPLFLDESARDQGAMTVETPQPARSGASETDAAARDHVCHISRHPRDGTQPERRPCPPLIAGAPRTSNGRG
jgi:hypothetical protein